MQVLFVHQNFPGQYPHLARALLDRGDRVHAIGGPTARPLPGVALHRYDPRPAGGIPECHPWVADLQTKSLRAEAVGKLLQKLLEGDSNPMWWWGTRAGGTAGRQGSATDRAGAASGRVRVSAERW